MKPVLVLALVITLVLSGCSLPGLPSPTATLPRFPPAATKFAPLNTLPPLPTFTRLAITPLVVTATQPPQPTPPPTATQAPPSATATLAAPTQAPTATRTPTLTAAATQAAPAATATLAAPTQSPATKTPTQKPPTSAPSAKEGKIFLIALGDNGASGKKIGCDDSVVGVMVPLDNPAAPLRSVLERLLAVGTPYYGQSGLYNALFRSDLQLQSVTISDGTADIRLSGALTLGGVCDNPRVLAQFEETALQFSTVKKVNVYINNKNLLELLSLK